MLSAKGCESTTIYFIHEHSDELLNYLVKEKHKTITILIYIFLTVMSIIIQLLYNYYTAWCYVEKSEKSHVGIIKNSIAPIW